MIKIILNLNYPKGKSNNPRVSLHSGLERPADVDGDDTSDTPYEPAGSEALATGNVQECLSYWRSFSTNKLILSWIQHGFPLLWETRPPAPREFDNAPSALSNPDFVSQAISEMLAAGAAEQLPPGQRPTICSPLGTVPKPRSEKLRLIINMRYVNGYLARKSFKFEGLQDLADILTPYDYLLQYDLSSGYYHIPLSGRFRTYFGFKWIMNGKTTYFQYRVLPFGLSVAPYCFSKIIRELVTKWRRMGLDVLPYLDDFLYGFRSYEAAERLRDTIETDFFRCGLRINFEKSIRVPVQCVRHLGFIVNTVDGTLSVPSDRWTRLQNDIQTLLTRPRIQARRVASLTGQIISMGTAFGPVTQLYTRYLYALLTPGQSLNRWIQLSEGALSELLFWQGLSHDSFSSPIWPHVAGNSIRLASDASNTGWGAVALSGPPITAYECFNEYERAQSSTYRELLGVFRALQALVHKCRNSLTVCQVDNLNLLSIVNRGSRVLPLNTLARDLFWFCAANGINLRVEWVPREDNELADAASRLTVPDDYQLNPRYFRWLDERWGPHTCDLFASSSSTHCPRFYSLHYCPGTAGINAFAYSWNQDNAWAHPPVRIIGRVWRTLAATLVAAATLVVPLWYSAPWWRMIAPDGVHLHRSITDWVFLPRFDEDLFLPSHNARGARQGRPPAWRVFAVRVDFARSPSTRPALSRRGRCLQGGCSSCKSP